MQQMISHSAVIQISLTPMSKREAKTCQVSVQIRTLPKCKISGVGSRIGPDVIPNPARVLGKHTGESVLIEIQ